MVRAGDLLGIDDGLSTDEKAVREVVRAYCERRLTPSIGEWFEAGAIPEIRELTRELGAIGALGMISWDMAVQA